MRQDRGRTELRKGDSARYIRASGVDQAIEGLAGPYGVRRFVLFFEVRGESVRLVQLAAVNLAWGGGPPPPDPLGERVQALERTMGRLYRNMATGPRWTRCAMGYTRDVDGRSSIFPSFGDAVDSADLSSLPMPGPPGHPLETPETLNLLAQWDGPLTEVRGRTAVVSADWDDWEIKDDTTLFLHYDSAQESDQLRRLRCRVLATYAPRWSRFVWQIDPPIFKETIFATSTFSASWDAAAEICMLCVARMRASWLFAQPIDEHDKMLLAAVWL